MAISVQNVPELQGFLVPNVRPTGRPLGHGAYGSVEEVEIPGALCAAKKIHDTLLRMGSPGEVRNMTAKFVEECQLMSSLRHPHIVQFLGICFLPGSRVPALIMEKLLTSVDELLERNPNIPLSIKRNILHDVARGLAYLHKQSPPIIHRDLTAKNVLLNSAMVAKITDLGVARIVDIQPGQLAATMSRAPGTIVYMPPEALEPRARYDTKIDIFSLGNLAMYILTQVFPELLAPTYADPQTRRLVARSEIERRIQYIRQIHQQLGREHPLVQMVEWCLENFPEDRPTILQVLRQLEQARALIPDRYGEMNKLEMVQALKEREREIQQQQEQLQLLQEPQQQLQSKDQQIRDLQAKEAESRQTVQALRRDSYQQQEQLQSSDRHIRNLQGELKAKEDAVRVREREIQEQREQLQSNWRNLQAKEAESRQVVQALREREKEIQQQQEQLQSNWRLIGNIQAELAKEAESRQAVQSLREREKENQQQLQFKIRNLQAEVEAKGTEIQQLTQRMRNMESRKQLRVPLTLKWRRGRNIPTTMNNAKAVVLEERVYFGGGNADRNVDQYTIQVYSLERDEWTQLPKCPVRYFAMATLNHQLVLAGGMEEMTGILANMITVWDSRDQRWTHPYPAMPSVRYGASALGYQLFLVVAGGFAESSLDVVEVLNTSTSQWHTVEPLPIPCNWMTSALLGDTLYLLGGITDHSSTTTALATHFPTLTSQLDTPHTQTATPPAATPTWETLPDVPLMDTTAVLLHNSLLAVGGYGQYGKHRSDIYLYTPSIKQWTKVGDLPVGLKDCACTELPSGEVLVLGGEGEGWRKSTDVHIGTVG